MQERTIREAELEHLRARLAEELEQGYKEQLGFKIAEIEAAFNDRTAKAEYETQLLKKALLQQSLGRLNSYA